MCAFSRENVLASDVESNYLMKMQISDLYRAVIRKFSQDFVLTKSLMTNFNRICGNPKQILVTRTISKIEKNELIDFQNRERQIWRIRRMIHRKKRNIFNDQTPNERRSTQQIEHYLENEKDLL
jgi:hypothetical protein